MQEINFPDWKEVLAGQEMPRRLKQSFEITIRWYLSYCRRGRGAVHFESARDFIDCVAREKKPQEWQLEQWKEAIRWFFREGKKQREKMGKHKHRGRVSTFDSG
jgi:hypothetical protein